MAYGDQDPENNKLDDSLTTAMAKFTSITKPANQLNSIAQHVMAAPSPPIYGYSYDGDELTWDEVMGRAMEATDMLPAIERPRMFLEIARELRERELQVLAVNTFIREQLEQMGGDDGGV